MKGLMCKVAFGPTPLAYAANYLILLKDAEFAGLF